MWISHLYGWTSQDIPYRLICRVSPFVLYCMAPGPKAGRRLHITAIGCITIGLMKFVLITESAISGIRSSIGKYSVDGKVDFGER